MKRFVDLILEKAPLQRKRLTSFLNEQDQIYWQRANDFAEHFVSFLRAEQLSIEYAVDSFLTMCKESIQQQRLFARTGEYQCKNFASAYENVYENKEKMQSYMIALLLSQFLWKNHYLIYDFFLKRLSLISHKIERYLEIGPGHGLFLTAALNTLDCKDFLSIDISSTSIELVKSLYPFFTSYHGELDLQLQDAFSLQEQKKYDFIVMGEVIEHIEQPQLLLKKLSKLLKPEGGRAFFTTCANCPMIDHIYLFRSAQEMRNIFVESGFKIREDLLLAVEERDVECVEKTGIPTNYAVEVSLADTETDK